MRTWGQVEAANIAGAARGALGHGSPDAVEQAFRDYAGAAAGPSPEEQQEAEISPGSPRHRCSLPLRLMAMQRQLGYKQQTLEDFQYPGADLAAPASIHPLGHTRTNLAAQAILPTYGRAWRPLLSRAAPQFYLKLNTTDLKLKTTSRGPRGTQWQPSTTVLRC